MLRRILASSRYLILIAVLGAFLSAVATLVYSGIAVIRIALEVFTHEEFTPAGAKTVAVDFIGLIDLLLLGTVLYIVALGLYSLFIDNGLPTPAWLHVEDLDELKQKLIGVIVVLLAVAFLGQVVEWKGDTSILSLGVSVALVIAALALLLIFNHHSSDAGQGSDAHMPPTSDT